MLKVYSKKFISTVVAGSLVFGLGTAVVNAAPKTVEKPTGRTVQNVQTGVISYDQVTVPRYAQEVKLTGTVVIDGPQLVVNIPGTTDVTVTKVADKIWKYEATVDVSNLKGNQVYTISAYTIYTNGAVAGSVHTSAPSANQTIHVPYVLSTVAENTNWTGYDRSENKFTLSYDQVQNWSVGDPVVTTETKTVDGSASEITVLDKTLVVPTAIQDFSFNGEPTWSFDSNTNTYSAALNIDIIDSKGNHSAQSVTKTGLTPGQVNTVSHTLTDEFGTITKTIDITAPAAPVVRVVPVEVTDLHLTLDPQGSNQFKVVATYTILYSNQTTQTFSNVELGGNIANPTTQNQNSSSKEYTIGGFVYNVTVAYNSSTKTYSVNAVKK